VDKNKWLSGAEGDWLTGRSRDQRNREGYTGIADGIASVIVVCRINNDIISGQQLLCIGRCDALTKRARLDLRIQSTDSLTGWLCFGLFFESSCMGVDDLPMQIAFFDKIKVKDIDLTNSCPSEI
jgi:hypothetical protein